MLLVDADRFVQVATTEAMGALLGMAVRSVDSVGGALDAVATERFDVAILDVGLPDGDGRDLCADLRRRDLTMPILMLTGAGREADVVRGLDAGANDYVVKPLRPYELAARVRAHLRQHAASEHVEMPVGDQLFHPGERTLSQPGRSHPTRLTVKEAAVLKHLYRANGQTVAREELLRHVWGYSAAAETHTVETHLYRLRRKVEPNGGSPRVLLHERGGYRLLRADAWERVTAHADDVNRDPAHSLAAR